MDESRELHVAADTDDLETVKKLIRQGHPLNILDEHERPAVTVAAEHGYVGVVKELINAGCELNTTSRCNKNVSSSPNTRDNRSDRYCTVSGSETKFMFPPLHAALHSRHCDIVKLLIATRRVDVNCFYRKETPLIIAAKINSFSLVKLLVGAGARVNVDKSNYSDVTTPINHAVLNGNYDMVEYFIKNSSKYLTALPLKVKSYRIPGAIALRDYGSLIELACQDNMADILSLLIDSYESDITFLCKHYALLWTCQLNNQECLDILLKRLYSTHCELNNAHLAQNHQQVLKIALRQNASKDETIPLKLLDHFGPRMFTDSTSYFITLHIAVLRSFPQFVRAMIKFIDMFPKTEDEETLHDICYSALNGQNLVIVKDLHEVGLIDVKYVDSAGENAAFNVVQSSRCADLDGLVEWLSGLGVDFNHKNNRGLAPIHAAATSRTSRAIEVLVQHGVHVDSRTSDGQTALHLALNTGWELEKSVVSTLLDSGADIHAQDDRGRTPITMFVLSYFNTFLTGRSWCLETPNGWRWTLDLLIQKLGCFLYCQHVIGHVTEADWQALVEAMSEEQRLMLQSFPNLQTLVWLRVRQSLKGLGLMQKVDMLPLPQPLKHYIKRF